MFLAGWIGVAPFPRIVLQADLDGSWHKLHFQHGRKAVRSTEIELFRGEQHASKQA